MKIQVNTDNTIEGTDTLAETVKSTVHTALDRYGDRLSRVEVHLSDDDDATGGLRCLLEARPTGMDPVVVTGTGDTAERSCHDATQKMQSLLDSTFGRIDSRDGSATIRQARQ